MTKAARETAASYETGKENSATPRKWLLSVSDFHRMGEAGILNEDDRVELIEGELIQMSPIGLRHATCVRRLNELLMLGGGGTVIIDPQNPIRLGDFSEPQPDLVVLKRRPDFYAQAHPVPEDIFLLVEVADTSASYDRGVKLPLYARDGVPEVWLVLLDSQTIEVYRSPSPEGYNEKRLLHPGDILSVPGIPGLELTVEAILC